MPSPPRRRSSRRLLAGASLRRRNPPSHLVAPKACKAPAQVRRRGLMTKLLITEITRMGPAFCVIGLQREQEKIQSIRPIPFSGHSWLNFPHQRGDILECALTPLPGPSPHIEDRVSTRGFQKSAAIPEPEVVTYLRKAEVSRSLPDFFECSVYENKTGSGLYAVRGEAQRSLCGWETKN